MKIISARFSKMDILEMSKIDICHQPFANYFTYISFCYNVVTIKITYHIILHLHIYAFFNVSIMLYEKTLKKRQKNIFALLAPSIKQPL
jgi:hypothetical protein